MQLAGIVRPDGLSVVEQFCLPPHVALPRKGPCPKHRGVPTPKAVARRSARTVRPAPAAKTPSLSARVAAGVVDTRKLSGGNVAQTDLLTVADGGQIVRKRVAPESLFDDYGEITPVHQQDAEELASLTMRTLNVSAPAVERTADDEILYEHIGDARPPRQADTTGLKQLTFSRQGHKIGFTDMLIDNQDRNPGNLLIEVDDEGKVILDDEGGPRRIDGIDHAWAYTWNGEPGEPISRTARGEFYYPYLSDDYAMGLDVPDPADRWNAANPLTQADVQFARPRLLGLAPAFKARNRTDWYERMMDRFEQLAARAGGKPGQDVLL